MKNPARQVIPAALVAIFTAAAIALPPQAHGGELHDAAVLSRIRAAIQHEMDLGELAQRQGHRVAVRQLGRRLYNDHQFANRELLALAERTGISLSDSITGWPGTTTAEQRKTLALLRELEGAAFDRALLEAVAMTHIEFTAMLAWATDDVYHAEVRRFMRRLVPILDQHLELVQHVRQERLGWRELIASPTAGM